MVVVEAAAEGTIEGASMMTVLVEVGVSPFWSVAAPGDGVGYCGARVELDGVHRRAVDVGRDAEVGVTCCEKNYRAGAPKKKLYADWAAWLIDCPIWEAVFAMPFHNACSGDTTVDPEG
jgi:hypothetical protein